MTDIEIEIATKIGIFEMKPKVDFCKDCSNCDLQIQTREFCYVDLPHTLEVRGECSHANACRVVYERCLRKECE